jgi:hypothetical protein
MTTIQAFFEPIVQAVAVVVATAIINHLLRNWPKRKQQKPHDSGSR